MEVSKEERQYMVDNNLESSYATLILITAFIAGMIVAIVWWIWSALNA